MRHRYIRGAVLAVVVAAVWPGGAGAQEGGFQPPVNSGDRLPIPTGRSGSPGFYFGAEFVMLMQTRAIGNQDIAFRGFYDTQGFLSGVPGTFIGSGVSALNTRTGGQRSFSPGFRAEIGYKFDTGTRIYANYLQLYDARYSNGATPFLLGQKARIDLADTFVTSPVYNHPVSFTGPINDTSADPGTAGGGNTAGIWNAADEMNLRFTQRYQQIDVGARIPLFATEHSTVYGLSGGRFAWFFERFTWRTVDLDSGSNPAPQNTAIYSNTLSQRMYGLFVGCGHEVYLGNMFSASLDLTGAAYMDVVKGRSKYKLGDLSTQSKDGRDTFTIVPSGTAEFNLWMYPTEGVQFRIGYSALTFFNTRYMRHPVGFNFQN
ncbi:MAG: hypothetical protein K2V38_04725, partial [Gemmataceae bacterium]|nr:hypothetical protein [Gemmataceae bacterium]